MAGLRSGALGVLPTINECRSSSDLGRRWGVDEVSTIPVGDKRIDAMCGQLKYGNWIINIFRHPHLLIPQSIDLWLREYEYAGNNYSITPYLDRHPCAIEAKELYDTALATFRSKK